MCEQRMEAVFIRGAVWGAWGWDPDSLAGSDWQRP